MNKKVGIKVIVGMVLCLSFLLCSKSTRNMGMLDAYAETENTLGWDYCFNDEDGEISVTGYYGKKTAIKIPSKIDGYTVTGIATIAFRGNSELTSITIPQTVERIEEEAFYGCSGLKSIRIPQSVKYIDATAFQGCSGLTSIVVDKKNKVYDSRNNCNAIIETASKTLIVGCKKTVIPKSVTSIGRGAFLECSSLTGITIPQNVTSIGDYAFWGCSSLKSIYIHQAVKKIGRTCFRSCTSLTSIVVDEKNKVYDSRNNCNAIIETASKTLIVGCKNTVIPNGVIRIGADAFLGCSSLTGIILPPSVTCIEHGAFTECSSLKGIEIPDTVTDISSIAFGEMNKEFTIYSSDSAYAHEYALDNNIRWRDINSKLLEDFIISLGKATYKYDGKEKRPAVAIEVGARKLTYGTDYTVAYADNVNVGTAKVIITGKGDYSGTVTKTFTINPTKVESVKQMETYSRDSIILSWKAMPGVDEYVVYRATKKNGTYKKVASVTEEFFQNYELEAGKTYYYKVCAYKANVKGDFSSVTVAGTKTKKPTLKVTAGKKKATLTWNKTVGADGYEIYMRQGMGGKYKKVKTVKADTTAFTKTKLAKGKKFSFKIRTYRTVSGKKIYSDWSGVKTVKIK